MTSPVLQYGRVEDWIGGLVMDGLDSDDLPDDVALTGTVKLEPMLSESAGGIRVPTMPKWLSVQPIVCQYSNGRLTHRGLPYVMLLAPNEATNPTNWKWNASFDLRLNGAQVVRKPFSFALPVYDPEAALVAGRNPTIVNLTTVQPVNVPGSGTGVVQGPIGFSITGVEIVEDGIQFYREAPGSPDGQLPVGVPVPLPAGSGVIEADSVQATMLAPEVREKVNAALDEDAADIRYAPVDPVTGMLYEDPLNPDLPTSITVDGVTSILTYDSAGNLTSKKRGTAATKTVTYDGQGRMTGIA
jgi:YD repeat-containing protein